MFFMLFTEKCLMKTWKNALILFLSTLVLTILMPLGAFAEEIDPLANATDLVMGVPAEAVFTQVNQQIAFRFQPSSSGEYYFYALDCEKDGLAAGGTVLTADASEVKDGSGRGTEKGEKSFLIGPVQLQAGQSYYLLAEVVNRGGKTGSYKVGVGQKITITLDAQEGTIGDSHQVDLEAISGYGVTDRDEILVPDLEGGKGFVSWKDSSGNTYDTEQEFRPADSATLTANYAAKVQVHFTTTFGRYPGAASDGKLDLSVGSGRTIFLKNYQPNLPDNSKRLISFKNTKTGTAYGLTDKLTISQETFIEAQFENNPSVTFKANGGTFENDDDSIAYVEPGGNVSLAIAVNPPSADQMLTGWKGSNGKTYDPEGVVENVTSNLTMTAVWQPFYTVTLDANGAQHGSPSSAFFDTLDGKPKTVTFKVVQGTRFDFDENYIAPSWTNENYRFADQYYLDSSGNEPVDMDNYVPTGNVILYAGWIQQVKVAMNSGSGKFADGKTLVEDYVDIGTTFGDVRQVLSPSNPTPNDSTKSFAGWKTNTGAMATDDLLIESNMTFTAQYSSPCTITFDPVNGSDSGYFEDEADADGKMRVTVPAGSVGINEPEKPEIENQLRIFSHWTDNKSTNAEVDLSSVTLSGNKTFYAVYTDAYTIELNTNGGIWDNDSEIGDDPEYLKFPLGQGFVLYDSGDPVKNGQVFLGWSTVKNDANTIVPDKMDAEDAYPFVNQKKVTTLWACYTPATPSIPITLDAGGGYFDMDETGVTVVSRNSAGFPTKIRKNAAGVESLARVHGDGILGVTMDDSDGFEWRLAGWKNGSGTVDPGNYIPKTAETITADWVKQYTVVFDAYTKGVTIGRAKDKVWEMRADVGKAISNHDTVDPDDDYRVRDLMDGSALNIPEGKKLIGWYTTTQSGGTQVDGSYVAGSGVKKLTIYPRFEEVVIRSDSTLQVSNTDEDGKELAGMSFGLYADQGCTVKLADYEGPAFSIGTADAALQSYLPQTHNGTKTLYLKQSGKPAGYAADTTAHPVVLKTVITNAGKNISYTVTTVNNKASLTVKNTKKTDTARVDDAVAVNVKDGNDAPLQGAGFVLSTDKKGNTVVEHYTGDHFEISTADAALANYLPKTSGASKTLYFLEKSAPEGYEAEDAVYSVRIVTTVKTALDEEKDVFMTTTSYTMTADGQKEIEIVNEKGIHKVHKAVSVSVEDEEGNLLEDVEYGLFADAEGTTKIAGFSGAEINISTTLTGLKNILPAPGGDATLYLIETKKPEGYEADQTVFEVDLWTESSETATATVITYNIAVENAESLTIPYKKVEVPTVTPTGEPTVTPSGEPSVTPSGEPSGTPEEGGETPDSGDPIDVKPDDSGNGSGSGTTPTPAPTVNPSVTPTAKPTPVETLPTKGADGTPVGAGASAKAAAGAIAASNSDEGPKGTKYAPLCLRLKKATKNAITIRWNKVSGATQYIIFGNACGKGKKFKEIGRTGAFSFKVTKLADGKKLAKKKYYKFLVMAVKGSGNGQQVVSTSKTVHITTLGGTYNNYKSVKLNKTKVTLKKGKKFQIKAKAVKRGKKAKAHRKMSYESSNPAVATVSKKGKVKAKKKGTATIYCYAADGTYKKLKVKVK